jgi:transcriptional regulator NrdR family protein
MPLLRPPETQVVETRVSEDGDFIRRRRQCGACEKRFTTYERPDVSFPGHRQKGWPPHEYERAKLQARSTWRCANARSAPSRSTAPSSASKKSC